VTLKNAVFWDVGTHLSRWFLARGFFYPEDGGDMFLRNVSSHNIYTAPHPRRRHSSNPYLLTSYSSMYLEVIKPL
jgi:hypothetical protein